MVFITHCDTPALWQTYLSDPASITMEGILIFNKHFFFLFTLVLFFSVFVFKTFSCILATLNYLIFSFCEKQTKNLLNFLKRLLWLSPVEWWSPPVPDTIFY